MRAILVDWMMEVCNEFMLTRNTFYQAVAIIDKFTSKTDQVIKKKEFQLIGTAAMLISAKMEEIVIPTLSNFILATDNSYT